jgi:hypothetical protein
VANIARERDWAGPHQGDHPLSVPERREGGVRLRNGLDFGHDAPMPPDNDERASHRDLVRRGYDAISHSYRGDYEATGMASSEGSADYRSWVNELRALLEPTLRRVTPIGSEGRLPQLLWVFGGHVL